MPFRHPWTDAPPDELVENMVAYHHRLRGEWRAESWSLGLVVLAGGSPAGGADLRGEGFAERREVESGSWLAQSAQGRGLGTELREAVLALAFGGLGAAAAISGAFEWNAASLRVSEKLGYLPAGETTFAPRGESQREVILRLDRAEWERRAHPPVEVDGLQPCLPLFGL